MAEDDKHVEIRIKLRPRSIERFIFVVIIMALLIMYFFYPLNGGSSAQCTIAKVATTPAPAATAKNETAQQNKTQVAAPKNETTQKKEEPKAETTTPTQLSGKIEIKILDVITIKSSADLEHDDKISKIKFSIVNGKEDFKPKIEVHWFDQSDEDSIKNLVRSSISYTIQSEAGKTFTDVISTFNTKFLSKTDVSKETFRLVLYDKDVDTELDIDTYDKTNI